MEISAKRSRLRVVNSLISPAQSAKIEIAKAYIRPLIGPSHKLHYPPLNIDAQKLDVDLEHINNERGRDITEAEARSYVVRVGQF